jgi:outer membrane biosynthesis protein TonB
MSLANLKKGDTVILHMFTGIAVGVKEVLDADEKTVTMETRAGEAKFSRKTGKQIEPPAKKERFANYITEDDGSYVPTKRPKKSTKKAKPEPEYDEDCDNEDEDEAPVKKPKKAKKAKKPVKKASKPEPEEDDFDEDDYEEE